MNDDTLLTLLKQQFHSPLIHDDENLYARFDEIEIIFGRSGSAVNIKWKDKVIQQFNTSELTFMDTLNIQMDGAMKVVISQ